MPNYPSIEKLRKQAKLNEKTIIKKNEGQLIDMIEYSLMDAIHQYAGSLINGEEIRLEYRKECMDIFNKYQEYFEKTLRKDGYTIKINETDIELALPYREE